MNNLSIQMIENVALALGDLNSEVIFVGGASVSLYLDLVSGAVPGQFDLIKMRINSLG